ncbi:MAG: helix-turn-helix transcriptional regulator [Actinomyces sp.]|nr:helix-turn-helix transcriptional regulator [Actinomyces sp.]
MLPSHSQTTFVISVAAELAGMHPQTLRQYDRLGLVTPARSKGRGRRYTHRDIQRLRAVQVMSQEEGINLAGIRRILDLERALEQLEGERDALEHQLDEVRRRRDRVFAASPTGEVSSLRRGERPGSARRGADTPVDTGASTGTELTFHGGALVRWAPTQLMDLVSFWMNDWQARRDG